MARILLILALAGTSGSACAPVPQTAAEAHPVQEADQKSTAGSPAGSKEGRVRSMENRLGLGGAAGSEASEASTAAPAGDPRVQPTGKPIEITCGDRDACRKEAKRQCPLGYQELSRGETAKPGWRVLPEGFGPVGNTAPAGQSNTGSYEPGSPVPQTRLVIQCH